MRTLNDASGLVNATSIWVLPMMVNRLPRGSTITGGLIWQGYPAWARCVAALPVIMLAISPRADNAQMTSRW